MVSRISADYALDWDDVVAQTSPGTTVGRPHIADALVARGHVQDRTAAFDSILHWRGGYYRPHDAPPPVDGVRLIAEAGGVPVIAHPEPWPRTRPHAKGQDATAGRRRAWPWKSITAGTIRNEDRARSGRRSRADGLVVTGSSDYHGLGKPNRLARTPPTRANYAAILARGAGSKPFTG